MSGIRMHQRWLTRCLDFLFISLIVEESYAEESKFKYNSGFLIDSDVCRIPYMGPFDPVVKKFYKKLDPLICNHDNRTLLVDSNNTAVYINQEAISHFYNDSKDVNCCWRAIRRVQHNDNEITFDTKCHKFVNSATITDFESVKVECSFKGTVIYKDYFPFVPRIPSLEEKYKEIRAKNNFTNDSLSVLLLGLDNVARNHLYRMMPKSIQMLKELDVADFKGFMKVGDNTFPNLVPAFSGLTIHDLTEACWPTTATTFDACPFIWKNFSAAGYRTIFAEDTSRISTFNYIKRGFRDPPTDYYLRPFCIASEREASRAVIQCLGMRRWVDIFVSYVKKVAKQFVDDPYFAIAWHNSISHDSWYQPQWGDDCYTDVIGELFSESLLHRTALIVMSDHGMRWGSFRQTYQGKMEDSNPFLFIATPRWWRKKHRKAWYNLRRNVRRMVTSFDLYETLKDLLHNENLKDSRLKTRVEAMPKGKDLPRGISLFLPIPNDRTCEMAGIPDEYCICHDSHEISVDNDDVRGRADFFVSKLNEVLKNYTECATLKLKTIKNAFTWKNAYDNKTIYTLTIETEPGNALFQAIIDYEKNKTNEEFVGGVSRVNSYGQQSACVNDYTMKLYCYCL